MEQGPDRVTLKMLHYDTCVYYDADTLKQLILIAGARQGRRGIRIILLARLKPARFCEYAKGIVFECGAKEN